MIRALLISAIALVAVPAAAENYYGAIAYSTSTGKMGRSWNLSSRAKAEERALYECAKSGGKKCKIAVWMENSCGAFAAAPGAKRIEETGISWGFNTHEDAKARAVKECQKLNKGNTCSIQTSSCNFGK